MYFLSWPTHAVRLIYSFTPLFAMILENLVWYHMVVFNRYNVWNRMLECVCAGQF